jgi:Nucleotidyl transferase AbiEii toxin, Type IV TA system
MHKEIFNKEQLQILPLLKSYHKRYYLVGGTAIALYLGHRESIDFDLFTDKKISQTAIKKDVLNAKFTSKIIVALPDQIHFIINNVKLTFYEFPYLLEANSKFEDVFRMPDLLTLGAMKAFALGGRGKWKDYVDLYFILKNHYTIQQIADKAKELFTDSFNPILFKKQICFFADINYSEEVNYLPGFQTDEQTIKEYLIECALS